MQHAKDILIISYTFPPAKGIGGRRWSKFSKYLSAGGHNIHVITSQSNNTDSEWSADVNESRVKIYEVKTRYPHVLTVSPLGIINKIRYRLWVLFFRMYSKGTLYDRSILWKDQLIAKAAEIIKANNIKNVIVTIPPFRMAFYSLKLGELFPGINLIVDYRDPWTDNQSFHGFRNLSDKRRRYEKKMEQAVIAGASKIITVSEDMTKSLAGKNLKFNAKFITVNNGYDDDEIESVTSQKIQPGRKQTTFVYTGSLYDNLNYVTRPFLLYLQALKKKDPGFYNSLAFDFYGTQDKEFSESVTKLGIDIVKLYTQIPVKEAHDKINEADFCLLFSAPDHSFSFNTKFFEYLGRRRPILLFSNKGATSDYISNNQLGACIFPGNMNAQLDVFFEAIKNASLPYNHNFDISGFSIRNLAAKVEALLV